MKKLIAILTALTMLFGVVCAFAEDDDADDILDELGEELEEELDDLEDKIEDALDETGWTDRGEEAPALGRLAGGWQAAADPEVTEDLQAIFDKGLEGLVGVDYVPVVYLGSQVVAGTNHAFLCQAAVVVPNAVPQWAVVYLYEDLEGNVTILDIEDFDFGLLCDYGSDDEE